jgi:hypothetical protein
VVPIVIIAIMLVIVFVDVWVGVVSWIRRCVIDEGLSYWVMD